MSDIEIGRGKRGRHGLLLRRHRHRAEPAHPRPGGGLGRLADRRLPVRDPGPRRRRWTRSSRRRRRSRSASSAALGVLNLEGLWTRYEDPEPLLAEIAGLRRRRGHPPDAGDLRRADPARAGRGADRRDPRRRASPSPPRCRRSAPRSSAKTGRRRRRRPVRHPRHDGVSAEHVSGRAEPLNLKQFIYELDVPVIVGGCATYQAALHLMRTGAAGVLVGFGGGASHTTRSRARRRGADGDRRRRRARGPPRLPRRVRRPLRARHRRRRRSGASRRHRPRRSPAAPTR